MLSLPALQVASRISQRGVQLHSDGAHLRYWPSDVVNEDPDLLRDLKANKSDLLRIVSDREDAEVEPPRRSSDDRLIEWLNGSAIVTVPDRALYVHGRFVPNGRALIFEFAEVVSRAERLNADHVEDLARLWEIFVWQPIEFGRNRSSSTIPVPRDPDRPLRSLDRGGEIK